MNVSSRFENESINAFPAKYCSIEGKRNSNSIGLIVENEGYLGGEVLDEVRVDAKMNAVPLVVYVALW